MRIGVLGTGPMAASLGTGWARAGHSVTVGGRSRERARAVAEAVGGRAVSASPAETVSGQDAVLLALNWDGVGPVLRAAGAHEGSLDGVPLLDPVNPVEYGTGVLRVGPGSAAERIAAMAPGADVVKAFSMFPAAFWERPAAENTGLTVTLCGDGPGALETAGELVRDLGAAPFVLGPLARARQVEEAAGFTLGLAFAGRDPHTAVPSLR